MGGGGGTYLVHFINNPLNFWLRISQGLEERGDPWDKFYALLWSVRSDILGVLGTGCRKYVVHDREFISVCRFIIPAGRNCIPNTVLQPLILAPVPWTGWSFNASDIVDYTILLTVTVWQYPREHLIVRGGVVSSSGMVHSKGKYTPRRKS
jgi:hypothetical protein